MVDNNKQPDDDSHDIPAFLRNQKDDPPEKLGGAAKPKAPTSMSTEMEVVDTADVKPADFKAAKKPAKKAAPKAAAKAGKAPAKKAKAEVAKPKKAADKAAKAEPKASKPKAAKDQFGLRKGSSKSEAAAMYARKSGATLEEVKEKVGSIQLNVLKELAEDGHGVRQERIERKGKRPITRYWLTPKA